ncbi:sister chromatid cohesion protein PDS5 homolog A isoform X2 [Cajanus cajan]|uniref:sister chromatid cohesion protein PDS5 homolog A isoform X2 n=1 Tax=Cajanus cajan TaxID=3821 RepID=UPI00098DCBCA|nr:sister chromatid cohesion protein PDS5 homolog A isoform X2 [Cajanus cajan]
MDEPSLQLVSEIATRLAERTRPNKDFILKSLRQATDALSELKQSPQPKTAKEVKASKKREAALKSLANAVVSGGLLQHADRDVRLRVAICVTDLFRLMAPEPPFEDKHLRDAFKLIISLFADLADTASPFFSKRAKVLETVAQLRCCVIMLEINCIDLVLEMFNTFFSVARDEHHDSLIRAMISIMINILSESEGASQQLLTVILRNIVKQKQDAAYQLAASVIETCAQEDELNPLVCGFLTSCIHDRDAMDSELKEYYHEIFFKVVWCAPQMLLDVVPTLMKELLADEVDVRIKTVKLVGKLFARPEHHGALKYHELFVEFVKKFCDKSVDVRISALQCAKTIYLENPYARESHGNEIITCIEDRLSDFDDQVRKQAVLVACDIFRSNLTTDPSKLMKLLSQATERLRDIKMNVRKSSLQKLIMVYQDYCKKCYEGSMTISNHFEEIPCKIMMLCYNKDCKEFRSQHMEFVLADDLFPKDLPVVERINHWIHMFSLFSFSHERLLNTILTHKRRFQNEMKNYLAMRKKSKEICSEERQKKIESMFTKMAAFFPDSHKAEECLHKLNQIKDNSVFKSLEKLLEEQAFTTVEQNMKDKHLVIGDNIPNYEFLRPLLSKCSDNIFSSEHVQCILDYLSNNENGNKDLEDSSANLLLAIVRNFPSMMKGLEKQFQKLLEQISPVNDKLIDVIAKAGSHMSFNHSDIFPFLKRICFDGTRRQAKFACSAIAALSYEQSVFKKLYEELIDSLYSEWNVPTILQSMGCIAQYCVSNFETRDEEITSYICQNIIQMEHSDDGHDATSFPDISQCSKSCQLKIYGLKALVKIYLHYKGSHVEHNINGLLDILSRMLRESDNFFSTSTSSCENDKAHIRLAAAKAILRLARKWDFHITPEIFRFTILIAKDSSLFVRSTFLNKTQKLLKEHKLPIRFACAFALEDMQYQNYKYMTEFIKDYSIVAGRRQTSVVPGAIVDYPAYILVFLIHVLARNNDFPVEVCEDEKVYADLCSPLFFILQVLVDVSIVDGDLDIVNVAVLHVFSIFRAIRKVEDAVDVQMTTLHMLAEIGIFALNKLNHGGISVLKNPGQVLLPSSLYRASSKCPVSFFDENFLSRVFHVLKKSTLPHGYAQKTAKSLPKHGHKVQQDVLKSNINIYGVLDLASKPDDLSRREIANDKSVRPNIPSKKRKKSETMSGSGSVGLHECSMIEKRQKLASKHSGKAIDRNLLSSSDPVRSESHGQTRKSKRAAASTLKNAVTSSNHTVEPFKCPRTKLKDTYGSKKNDILADVSNKSHFSLRGPDEYSSVNSIQATVTRSLATKEGTPLNSENTNVNERGKYTETPASGVVNTKTYAVRTRRKV